MRSIVHKEKRDGGKKPRGLLEVSVGGREKWDRTASTCARNKMNETWAKEMGGVESSLLTGTARCRKGDSMLGVSHVLQDVQHTEIGQCLQLVPMKRTAQSMPRRVN